MNRAERRRSAPTGPVERANLARRRTIIVYASLALVAIVVLVAVAFASRAPQTASTAPTVAQISVGQTAPEFKVTTDLGAFDLATAGGRPTLLELFATWCPHCQNEVAVLNGLYDRFRGRVNFLGVSANGYGMDQRTPESQADVLNVRAKAGRPLSGRIRSEPRRRRTVSAGRLSDNRADRIRPQDPSDRKRRDSGCRHANRAAKCARRQKSRPDVRTDKAVAPRR